MIYHIHIFNRKGQCIYSFEWNHLKPNANKEHDNQLFFGLLFTMKDFVNKISPRNLEPNENETIYSYTTPGYALHYFETPTALRFALTTDPHTKNIQDVLKKIYNIFVDCTSLNPHYIHYDVIDNTYFHSKLQDFIIKLPFFT